MSKLRSGGAIGRDALLLSLGKYGQFAVTLITLPLIARTLETSEFGVYAVGTGLFFLGSIYSDWGLSLPLGARFQSKQGLFGDGLRGTFFLFRLAIFAIALLIAVVLLLLGISPIYLLAFFAGAISSLGEEWLLVAEGKFLRALGCQWIGRALYLGIVFIVLPVWPNVYVPFVALALGAFVSSIFSWRFAGRPKMTEDCVWNDHVELFRLGLPVVIARVLLNFTGSSLSVLLAGKFSFNVIAIFSGSDRLIRAGVSALDSVVVAQFPRVNAAANTNGYRFRLLLDVVALALTAGVCANVVIWFSAPIIETILYAGALPGVVDVLRLGSFIIPAAALVSTINTNVFSVRQRTMPLLWVAGTGVAVALSLIIMLPQNADALAITGCIVIAEWTSAIVAVTVGLLMVRKVNLSQSSLARVNGKHP